MRRKIRCVAIGLAIAVSGCGARHKNAVDERSADLDKPSAIVTPDADPEPKPVAPSNPRVLKTNVPNKANTSPQSAARETTAALDSHVIPLLNNRWSLFDWRDGSYTVDGSSTSRSLREGHSDVSVEYDPFLGSVRIRGSFDDSEQVTIAAFHLSLKVDGSHLWASCKDVNGSNALFSVGTVEDSQIRFEAPNSPGMQCRNIGGIESLSLTFDGEFSAVAPYYQSREITIAAKLNRSAIDHDFGDITSAGTDMYPDPLPSWSQTPEPDSGSNSFDGQLLETRGLQRPYEFSYSKVYRISMGNKFDLGSLFNPVGFPTIGYFGRQNESCVASPPDAPGSVGVALVDPAGIYLERKSVNYDYGTIFPKTPFLSYSYLGSSSFYDPGDYFLIFTVANTQVWQDLCTDAGVLFQVRN